MSNDVWRWADPDGQQRRVRLDELRAALVGGHIAPNTPVWRPGWQAWQPAHEVPELTSVSVSSANGVVLNIPPPPLAMVAVQQDYEKKSESIAPAPLSFPPPGPEPEPPPPPRFVPSQSKMPSGFPSSANMSTVVGVSSASVQVYAPVSSRHNVPTIPTAVGMPAPVFTPAAAPPSDKVIELSSASILEATSSAPELGHAPPPNNTPLFLHDQLPIAPGPIAQLRTDLENLKAGRPLQHKPVVIAAALLAGVVGFGVLGTIITLATGGSKPAKPVGSASASASAPPPPSPVVTAPVVTASATPPPPPKTTVFGDCTVSGDSKLIAPRALGAAAIEAQSLNGNLALGFAPTGRDAVATMLDPASLAPLSTVKTKPGGGDVRRVTPVLNGTKLAALPDVDRRGDALAPRRSVATSPLVDVGVADGALVWAPHGKDSFAKLFALDGDAPVEALRAIPLRDRTGIGVTFRRDNAIRIGVASGTNLLAADGDLAKLDGLGQGAGTLGSPSIASTGDRVVVAWADRASQSDDWSIRWTTLSPHGVSHEASPFTLPEGGLGGNAMSPALASLGGGRFLLAWTEGPVSGHHVRAIAFAADGSTSGTPILISASGENAGQPAIAINDDGKGVIAYLAAAPKGKGLEVHATPISCPRQP